VTVCGGAAPRGAPVRLWTLLAMQCPRLQRLSGGAAAPISALPAVQHLQPSVAPSASRMCTEPDLGEPGFRRPPPSWGL